MKLFLCGDVMTGRAIDQVLPSPSEPGLYEPYVHDARDYVRLAERVSGAIPRPAELAYVWGTALAELERAAPDARVVNLETSITRSADPWPDKGIHYRMHPANVGCLNAAGIDCCVLANNHVLDWGRRGLEETLTTLEAAGIATAGAGRAALAARAPAVLERGAARLLVFGCGTVSSGIPPEWRAAEERSGVWLVESLGRRGAAAVVRAIDADRRPGDVVVVSVHWGGNWGYAIPPAERAFAHALIDSGSVDVVHGHSSHHAKGIEVYRGKPILYGCGDFLNDYEGISGHERYRGDLSLMYFVTVGRDRQLESLDIVVLEMHRFSLRHATAADADWIAAMLTREGAAFGMAFGTAAERGANTAIRIKF